MYNRYQGNTGRFIRLPEPFEQESSPTEQPRPSGPAERTDVQQTHGPERTERPEQSAPGPPQNVRRPGPTPSRRPPQGGGHMRPPQNKDDPLGKLLGNFGGSLSGRLSRLETEDLLLLAVVYLMYRESGDKQLLIVLAALLLF